VVCFVAVALSLPIETILLRAGTTTSQQSARDWAGSLSLDQAVRVSGAVQTLPFEYRRSLMRVLPPAIRAAVWSAHIKRYIAAHPNLDSQSLSLLNAAASLATADAFSQPSTETRVRIAAIAQQIIMLLGAGEADYLFYRLGPRSASLASALPLTDKLAEFVRSQFVVEASREDCDCHVDFGCDSPGHCVGNVDCNKSDGSWPECGWFWMQQCDGLCYMGIAG
jgi:hypothetical protein